MNLKNKAQGAMEYLMTYGWAILVVMVVGIVMWQLGIFDLGGSTVATYTGFSGNMRPQMGGTGLTGAGAFTLTLLNVGGDVTTVDTVTLSLDGAACADNTCTAEDTDGDVMTVGAASTIFDVANNEHFVVQCAATACTGNAGDAYDLGISVGYTANIGGVTVTKSIGGTVRAAFE